MDVGDKAQTSDIPKTLIEAATLANRAAGVVVSHLGTAPITAEELLKA